MMGGKDCFVVGDGVQADVGCDVYFGVAEVGAGKVAESYICVGEVGTFKVGIAQVQFVEECRAEVVGAALFLTKSGDYFSLNVLNNYLLVCIFLLHLFFSSIWALIYVFVPVFTSSLHLHTHLHTHLYAHLYTHLYTHID